MKCANCDTPAAWVYDVPSSKTVAFCEAHLPTFLSRQADSGALRKPDSYEKAVETAPAVKKAAPKKSTEDAATIEDPAQD